MKVWKYLMRHMKLYKKSAANYMTAALGSMSVSMSKH